MAKDKRTLSDQEREQRRAEQRELVRASIEQLRSSEGWQAYLKVRSRFHSYSWQVHAFGSAMPRARDRPDPDRGVPDLAEAGAKRP